MRTGVLWPQVQQHLFCMSPCIGWLLRLILLGNRPYTGSCRRFVLLLAWNVALLFDFLTQFKDPLNQRFRARRTYRYIHIDGNYLVHALHRVIAVVELAAGVGALPHANDPFRFGHLLP